MFNKLPQLHLNSRLIVKLEEPRLHINSLNTSPLNETNSCLGGLK